MAERANLDLDTLRTLVTVHDLGGLGQAADRLGRTPSAISLQMKRLQDDLGTALFRKQGRGIAFTEAGEVALSYARRMLEVHDELLDTMQAANLAGQIRLGCAQDFASMLPSVLSRFARLFPRAQLELRIEGNSALADAIGASRIDLAVILGHEDRATARTVGSLDLVWVASPAFAWQQDSLPLAVLGPQCVFRKRIIEKLEATNVPYRIAVHSPSLNGLWAGLLGGLGITARTALELPGGLLAARSWQDLPPLGSLPVTIHRGLHARGAAVERLAVLLTEEIENVSRRG